MKYPLYILFFLTNCAIAQKMPESGVNRVRITGQDKTFLFEVTSNVIKVPLFSSSLYYWYGSNQVNSTQGSYSGKLLNGSYREFYLNKNLKTQGFFESGLKTGIWKRWSEDGSLLDIVGWKKSFRDGPYKIYGPDGRVAESGNNRLGKLDGVIQYFPKSDSVVKIKYRNGFALRKDTVSFWRRLNIFHRRDSTKFNKPR